MRIILSILLLFIYSSSYAQEKYKVIYFTQMGEIANTGKMFFRGRIELSQLEKSHQEKEYYTLMYYKVYHRNLPYKVEEYHFKSNTLKTTYWFDKNARNFQFRKHQAKHKNIDCTNTFSKKQSIVTKIERCNNQHQITSVYDDWRWLTSYYYQNAKMYKKEILKNERIYTYKGKKQISSINYVEHDVYPMHLPELDDYPWF
jgi:hypothetical protein